jgi:hypothetical protein
MKKIIFTLATVALLTSCSKTADDYKSIVTEYKKVACTAMDPNSSLSDKTAAVAKQSELNQEFQKALGELEMEEVAKLNMMMANALAEVSQGKCN